MVQFGRGFPIRGVTQQGVSLAEAAPTVTTGSATGIAATQATLNGTVIPGNQTTTYHFEYGPTVGYGTSIPLPDGAVGSDNTSHAVAQTATSLSPGATYHYRLVATNPSGTVNGSDQVFTTLPASVAVAVAKQYEVLDSRPYRLRHIRPQAGGTTVLNTAMGFEWLPSNPTPMSRDFASGHWTGRLGDAGEFQLTFPNTLASDGIPWRSRFSTVGHTEFVEIYRDDVLEFVGVILTVTPDQQQVVVTGQDGWFLLKKAFERDFTTVMAPRDVVERYTSVQVPVLTDGFTGVSLDASKWTTSSVTANITQDGLVMANTGGSTAKVTAKLGVDLSQPFSLVATVTYTPPVGGSPSVSFFLRNGGNSAGLLMLLPTTNLAEVRMSTGAGLVRGTGVPLTAPASGGSSLELRSDGRWLSAYIDGALCGYLSIAPLLSVGGSWLPSLEIDDSSATLTLTCRMVVLRQAESLLTRGADKGDYVLPGAAATYPTGGLTGHYYNDLDLASDTDRTSKLLNPGRTSLKGQQDATVNNPTLPQATNWSARWFGAIYLRLSQGNYGFAVDNLDDGARLWVGKTSFGSQIIDDWNIGAARKVTATLTAASLGGKDGWYPIILEYFQDSGVSGVQLRFTPPASYTDPGGTSLTAGTEVIVPATSLSPLGCVDNRFQGQSHFDIVQQTGQAFGYQLTCEPMQLESGEFPGRLAPRVREGRDTDEIIERDDIDRRSPIVNYQATEDATDQVSSLRGNGAGVQDGSSGQVTTEMLDVPSLTAGLFDLQGWQDATDVTIAALLQARLNAQLGLQLVPWQNITGDPTARDRLADSFPLTGTVTQFNWRPGDGVRLVLPDVNVVDQTPRQMLQITRQFVPGGRTGTQVGFRQRPKEDAYVMRKLVSAALRPQRTYQRQYVMLPGNYIGPSSNVTAGGFSGYSIVPLLPSDKVIKAVCRIVVNDAAQPVQMEVNTVLDSRTFTGIPAEPDITGLATQRSSIDCRLFVRLKNTGGAATNVDFQLLVTVLR
ncbi:MAG TPA: hypothetical protein VFF79_12755 [Conexibacter sp.]|jgi:hypothetical protein|nr:hypothetical protein [Conexibacter sp.]